MKKLLVLLLALTLVSGSAQAASQSIWGSTARGPAVSTMRFPVDISVNSTPGYLQIGDLATYTQTLIGCSLSNYGGVLNSSECPPRLVTAGTDNLLASDAGKIVHYTGAGAAVGVVSATTTGFTVGWGVRVDNDPASTGNVVITPTGGSTIGGGSSYTIAPGRGAYIYSDTTNYQINYGASTASVLAAVAAGSNGALQYYSGGNLAGAVITGLVKGNGTSAPTAATVNTDYAAASAASRTVGITVDGGGSTPATGVKGFIRVPYAGTITGYAIESDLSGSAVIDIWKVSGAIPTVSNTITASALPTLSSAQYVNSTTLTGWTTSVAAGDVIGFNLNSASTLTRVSLQLYITSN